MCQRSWQGFTLAIKREQDRFKAVSFEKPEEGCAEQILKPSNPFFNKMMLW